MTALSTDGLLRHAPPMRLVETVLAYDPVQVTTETTVRANWPFVHGGVVLGAACFELMTQSVAAYLSLMHSGSGTHIPGIPVVTRIHELTIHQESVSVGAVLHTDARLDAGNHVLGSFRATVRRGDALVVEGRFTVGEFKEVHG